MREKRTFKIIFALFAIFLAILPFIVAFNESLTHLVEKFQLYLWVQRKIVPVEVSMVSLLVQNLGVALTASYQHGFVVNGAFLEMTWNCLGWQSLLLLMITLAVGLSGAKYTTSSIIETIGIGLLGTFMVNLIRLTLIVLIFVYFRPIYFYVYHNYLAAIFTLAWLIFFWWFSYRYVLIGKKKLEKNAN
jgi:exosortase/archaeosortase family protein